jgi:16S rRNA C967 or C1407 C5-methylase (RsmB/RsmF family)
MFPVEFKKFLESIGSSLEFYTQELPRFIRFKPDPNLPSRIEMVSKELNVALSRMPWVNCYGFDRNIRIANSKYFKLGWFYGIDAASAFAVEALEINSNDHVLDLCVAPAGKLAYISDLIGMEGNGTCTGIDISQSRLFTAKNLLLKYKHQKIRLFLLDGQVFDVRPPTKLGGKTLLEATFKDCVKFVKPFYASRLLRNDPQYFASDLLYDKVLVDAECTHDGSISHIDKFIKNDWKDLEEKFLNKEKLKNLQELQRGLISNGFRLLKPHGILVYSTCSYSKAQNEDIVEWLLFTFKNSRLIEIEGNFPKAPLLTDKPELQSCIRFSPKHSRTSGLFVAKITKT